MGVTGRGRLTSGHPRLRPRAFRIFAQIPRDPWVFPVLVWYETLRAQVWVTLGRFLNTTHISTVYPLGSIKHPFQQFELIRSFLQGSIPQKKKKEPNFVVSLSISLSRPFISIWDFNSRKKCSPLAYFRSLTNWKIWIKLWLMRSPDFPVK